jgi:hypothetical protein
MAGKTRKIGVNLQTAAVGFPTEKHGTQTPALGSVVERESSLNIVIE